MSERAKYGWISDSLLNMPHTEFLYTREDGSRVMVCGIQDSPGPPNCGLPDAVMVGKVDRLVRSYVLKETYPYGPVKQGLVKQENRPILPEPYNATPASSGPTLCGEYNRDVPEEASSRKRLNELYKAMSEEMASSGDFAELHVRLNKIAHYETDLLFRTDVCFVIQDEPDSGPTEEFTDVS